MIATGFEYHRPGDLAEAVVTLASDPENTAILGGGTWLVPDLERGDRSVRRVLDLAAAGLRVITSLADGGLRVGAMCTYSDLLGTPETATRAPLLALMAAQITGGVTIRNQATLGGSVIAARPQSDAPAVMVSARAVGLVAGCGGDRRVPAHELFAGAMRTSLEPSEILWALELPAPSRGNGYQKLKLMAGSWPIATAAACLELDEAGRCRSATLTLGAVSATPLQVPVESVLVGFEPSADALAAAAELAAHALTAPWDDALAPAAYRAAVAAPLALRALTAAARDAAGAPACD
ncbi:MAG TPA: FAD binding domain-containing protein [Solirubrobacteraceae bacterium]|jgi:carbon-monoxide dehydrogenase medium subunit